MFKEKSSKKRIQNTNHTKDTATLDAKHQQKVSELAVKYTGLTGYLEERQNIDVELFNCNARIKEYKDAGMVDSQEYDTQWSCNIDMQDRLDQLDQIIEDLQSSKEEIEYYENTGRILFRYYDVIQNQDAVIPKTAVPMVTATRRKNAVAPPTRSILDAFAGIPHTATHSVIAAQVADKSTLVDEYVALTDPTYIQHSEENGMGQCALCNTMMVCIQHEGVMICPNCGYQDVLLVEQNRPLLRQVTKESTASYKRINHLQRVGKAVAGHARRGKALLEQPGKTITNVGQDGTRRCGSERDVIHHTDLPGVGILDHDPDTRREHQQIDQDRSQHVLIADSPTVVLGQATH